MFFFTYILVIISFLDTFSQFPIISSFAQSLGASSIYIGLIVGVYSFSNIFGNIISGFLIDKFGKKKLLMLSMLYISSCLLLYTVVKSPIQLMFVRFLHGFGGGLLVPAVFAFLGDISKVKNRGKAMAFSGACIGLAAIIGPAFGSMTKQFIGINWVFYVLSVLFLLFSLLIPVFIKEKHQNHNLEKKMIITSPQQILRLLTSYRLVSAYISIFALTFTLGALVYLLPLKVQLIGLPFAYSGMLLSTFGLVAILIFILPSNKIFNHLNRERVIIYGMFLILLSLFALSVFENSLLLFISMGLYGIGFAFMFPSINALVLDQSNQNERGKAFGLFYAFFSLGVVVGSFLIGALNLKHDFSFIFSACVMSAFFFILLKRSNFNRIKFQSE